MEQARIEFYETEDIEYNLVVEIHVEGRELQSIPYVRNDDDVGNTIGKDIDIILGSKGYKGKDLQIIISQLNQNNQKNLSNPEIPRIVKERLKELNYSSCIN